MKTQMPKKNMCSTDHEKEKFEQRNKIIFLFTKILIITLNLLILNRSTENNLIRKIKK